MFSFFKNKKSKSEKNELITLPNILKLPETTFWANGKEYWLGMSVSESGLKFQDPEVAHKIMEPNMHSKFPDCTMVDSENRWINIGVINRGTEPLPYKDCEIYCFNISTDDFADGLVFFNGVTQSSPPREFIEAFAASSFEVEAEEDDIGDEDCCEEEKYLTCTYVGITQKITFEFFEDEDLPKDGLCDVLGVISIECI